MELFVLRFFAYVLRFLFTGSFSWGFVVALLFAFAFHELVHAVRRVVFRAILYSLQIGYFSFRRALTEVLWERVAVAWGWLRSYCVYVWAKWRMWLVIRKRRQIVRLHASNRVQKVLDQLDLERGMGLEEALEGGHYIRASVLWSRRCRLALRFPKYSAANEQIVVDWFNKNLPEDMPFSVRFRIIPLAAKLTFVKSQRELRADEYFEFLKPCVEMA